MKQLAALLAALAFAGTAYAQGISPNPQAQVPTATGAITGVADFVWNGSAWVAATQAGAGSAGSIGPAGTNGTTAQSVQGINGGVPQPTLTSPNTRTIVTLDVKTVTTGGTAVTALTAGHRTAGGFISNPGAVALCINEIGTATGTTSAGDTTCIAQGATYNLAAATTAVSVISSDSAHPFSGYGLQ